MCQWQRCHSFCFQAEDGIRDLVRSRGLGDVYKRQAWIRAMATQIIEVATDWRAPATPVRLANTDGAWPVSYTHLTLPTSDLV